MSILSTTKTGRELHKRIDFIDAAEELLMCLRHWYTESGDKAGLQLKTRFKNMPFTHTNALVVAPEEDMGKHLDENTLKWVEAYAELKYEIDWEPMTDDVKHLTEELILKRLAPEQSKSLVDQRRIMSVIMN